jgi:hypothetical protein
MITSVLALRRDYLEWRRQRRARPEERIRRRQELKSQIGAKLPPSRADYAPELIVRDLARVDAYPDIDDRPWGISPWFGVEAKGLYHRGLEVFLAIDKLVVDKSVARPRKPGADEDVSKFFIVGRVPFDAIVSIDWDGDEYYPVPHIYCWFDQSDGPYESVVLYEPGYQGHLFLRDDLRYRPYRRSRLARWRDHRALLKAQRDFERDALSSG